MAVGLLRNPCAITSFRCTSANEKPQVTNTACPRARKSKSLSNIARYGILRLSSYFQCDGYIICRFPPELSPGRLTTSPFAVRHQLTEPWTFHSRHNRDG